MDVNHPYHQHLDLIGQVIQFICLRRRLRDDEAEDFSSHVHIKLLEEDSLILRKFKGSSSLKTYLVTVVNHLFQDYRIMQWGKWRPSAAAKRLGSTAELLETLMARDRYTFDQAVLAIQSNYRMDVSYEDLYKLACQLPVRIPRVMVDEERLSQAQHADRADAVLFENERRLRWKKVEEVIGVVLGDLDPEDRLILKMSFWDRFTVVQIAKTLNADQKPLYRRLKKILDGLRVEMEAAGVDAKDARDLIEETL